VRPQNQLLPIINFIVSLDAHCPCACAINGECGSILTRFLLVQSIQALIQSVLCILPTSWEEVVRRFGGAATEACLWMLGFLLNFNKCINLGSLKKRAVGVA